MFQSDLLQDKLVLVTGGGSGLGLSMAKRFHELGANIAICGRNSERLAQGASSIRKTGGDGRVSTFVCDVRDHAAVQETVDTLEQQAGLPDVLVNNAAGNFLAASEDLSPGGFDAVVKIVLYGTFNFTQAVGKKWIDAKRAGNILNIITTYAWNGSAFVLPSACAKAGVLAMTRSLAVEWATYDIRVNAIAPGPFPTEGAWKRLMAGGAVEERAKKRIPSGRFGDHEELANLAVFLVSDQVKFITGEVVTIDGGEAIAGAGQFSTYIHEDRQKLKQLLQQMKKGR